MQLDQRILARFDDLVALGNQVGPAKQYVNSTDASQWATSTLHLLRSVFGDSSTHVTKFPFKFDQSWQGSTFRAALGNLLAAKDDYEHGMLFNTRTLIQAEVFDDFLGQAEALHDAGYYQAAAVVAGAVLEDGLRKLCDKHGICSEPRKLDRSGTTTYTDTTRQRGDDEWRSSAP